MDIAFSLLVGGGIGWGIAHYYAFRSTQELEKKVFGLLEQMSLIATGVETVLPNAEFTRDENGIVDGVRIVSM